MPSESTGDWQKKINALHCNGHLEGFSFNYCSSFNEYKLREDNQNVDGRVVSTDTVAYGKALQRENTILGSHNEQDYSSTAHMTE